MGFEGDQALALPPGWKSIRLDAFLRGNRESVNPSRHADTEFLLYSVPAFDARAPEQLFGSQIKSSKQRVRQGDVLICKINPRINRSWVVADSGNHVIASTEWIVLTPPDWIDPNYLCYFLSREAVRQFLAANVSGVGGSLMRIRPAVVGSIELPYPPIETQRLIVARISELFGEIEAGEQELAEAKVDLARYRRAVLRAAVTGALTREWREQNPPVETGADLLARILQEQRACGVGRKVSSMPPPAVHNLHIPDHWVWCRVQDIGEVALGRQRAPQHHSGEHMRPYLRVANVLEGKLDLGDVKQMNFTPSEFETFALRPGDVLLNEGQSAELVGRSDLPR